MLSAGETWRHEASGIAEDLTAAGPASTFDLNGGTALDGPDGNIRGFSAGGVSLNAGAFSRARSDGSWAPAYLGSYGCGLGVTDTAEGDGNDGRHRVDHLDRESYVLFEFSRPVIVDQAFLDSVVSDSDVTVWIGTVANAFANHLTLSDGLLDGLEFTEVNTTGSAASRWADFNAGEVAGNVLVIAAWTGDTTPEDQFKISKVVVQEPVRGCYGNDAVVTTGPGGPTDTDASHYRNPENRPPVAVGDHYEVGANRVLEVIDILGVLSNDTDADGDALAARVVQGPSHGQLELGADGSFRYVPAAGYHGPDQFTYLANDGTSDSDPATVAIDVIAAAPETVRLEAEWYSSISSPWVVRSSTTASGGAFLRTPNNGADSDRGRTVTASSCGFT